MSEVATVPTRPRAPWNRGRIVGPKPPLWPKHTAQGGRHRALTLESMIRYLGIKVDDALILPEQTEI